MMVLALLGMSQVAQSQSQGTIDLSVHTHIDRSKPALGDVVTYTVVVSNAPSLSSATGVVVKNTVPDGATYQPSSVTVLRGGGSYDSSTGNWAVGTLASGDSAVLTLKATVQARGVWFDIAEVTAADQQDVDSSPNNHLLYEDDYEGSCFSVPLELYPGDEFTVEVPSGYQQITWYRNDVDVKNVPADSAVINSDSSLTIKSIGTYRFTTYNKGCPSSNCCDIEVIRGPYGSLGNFVFLDNNKDNVYDSGDTGLDGVKVYLYDQTGTTKLDSTVTADGGKYLFNKLRSGTYKVRFVAPDGLQFAQTAPPGSTTGSSAGADGFTGIYTIDTEKDATDPARSNMTVNAGLVPKAVPPGTASGMVFADANGNGIRETGDAGIDGIKVTLVQNGTTVVKSTTTTTGGVYSFTGIVPGNNYTIVFDTTGFAAQGLALTTPNATTNTSIDSDALAGGSTAPFSLTTGQSISNIDAGVKPNRFDLALSGSAPNNGPYYPGDQVVYVVNVTNNGNVPAYNVVVGDRLPTGLTLVPGGSFSSVSGGVASTTLAGPLAPGQVVSLTLVAMIDPTFTGNNLHNVVEITAADNDTNPGNTPPTDVNSTPNNNVPTENDQVETDLPVGRRPTSTVGGIAFVDVNGNGIRETEDTGLSNIIVTLFQSTTAGVTQVASTTTTATGLYSFTGITAGSGYYVKFDTLGLAARGFVVTVPNATTNTAIDSNAGPNGETAPFSLTAGEVSSNIDAGFQPKPASINSIVFLDTNNDGQRNTGEGGVAGVNVSIFRVGQTSPVQSFITDSNGRFQFAGLQPNVGYYVVFDTTGLRARGYGLTLQRQGNPATDSDADPVTGRTDSFTLTPGESNTSVSAGLKLLCPTNFSLTVASVAPVCPGETAQLTASTPVAGATINWYASAGSSQPFATVSSGTSVTVASAQTTVYYVSARNADGCVSPQQSVTVSVTTVAMPMLAGGSIRNTCPATTADLTSATITNRDAALTYEWYTSAARSASTKVSNLTAVNAGTYYVFAKSASGCYSNPAALTAQVVDCGCQTVARVDAGPSQTSCGASPVTLVASLSGSATSITWSANGTGTFSNPTSLTTTFTPSATDVASTSVVITATTNDPDGSGVCVAGTSSLVLTINNCKTDLAVVKQITTPGSYSLGQTVSYSITVSNKGNYDARTVTVSDKLPASLSFVSATPVADYNANTGIWTVGTLTAGSQRSLIIQATTTGIGTVRNRAALQSPDNDLALGGNDSSSVDIQVDGCTAQAPSIASNLSEICKGGTATLTATGCAGGTIRWSDGQTGLSVSVSPAVSTNYTASCVQTNGCISSPSNAVSLTVRDPQTPTLVASADNVCPGGQVTLTASGCTGGTYQWSASSETGASIIVSPTSRTTYTVQCRQGACVSPAASITIGVGSNLPKPTIVASTSVACSGEQVTLTINGCSGTPVWSSTTATTGSIVVSPTASSNSYTVYCKNGACVSPVSDPLVIRIAEPAAPSIVASADSVCSGSRVTLTANGCDGTVLWSNGQTGASITVTPTSTISYTAQCKVRECLSATSAAKPITVVSPSAPIVKADKLMLCSGERLTLTAEGCTNGIVKWTGTDAVGASINILPTETKEYSATCRIGSCESAASNKVRVTVNTAGTPPTIAASTTATCSGSVVTLTATGCNGTVVWSDGQTGASVSVTATAASTQYFAVCRVGTNCASGRSNVVTINTTASPAPTIVASTGTICPGGSATLTVGGCSGTPVWSTGESTASIVVSPTVNTSYSVYCQNGTCQSASSTGFLITVSQPTPPTISASSTTVVAGGTVTLTATGCTGTIVWSANGVDGTNTGASIVVKPEGSQTYYAQCKIGDCISAASSGITINQGNCAARAGTLVAKAATVCAGDRGAMVEAIVNGGLVHPDDYTVAYVLTTGTNRIVSAISPSAAFTVAAQSADYTIHTLVYDGRPSSRNYLDISLVKAGLTSITDISKLITDRSVCADVDLTGATIRVRYLAAPQLVASTSLTTCAGSPITLTAQGCEGGTITWSDNSVGASITRTPTSSFSLTATCSLDGCTSSPSQPINVVVGSPQGIPSIVGTKTTICLGEAVSLTAIGCQGGTLVWSDGTTGSVLTATPTASTSYRVKCVVGTCESDWSAFTPVTVGAPAAPTVLADGSANPSTCSGSAVVLTAQGCPAGSTITWSNGQAGASITVMPTATTTYTARCTTSGNCQSAPSGGLTVTVLPKPSKPVAVDKTNSCPLNVVDLSTAVTSAVSTSGGSFEYYTSTTLSSSSLVGNSASVGTGTYYVVEKSAGGCYSDPATIHVQINTCETPVACNPANPVTVNAGPDAVICGAKTYRLQGTVGGAAQKLYWKSSGNGTFDNPFSANAIYTASVEDILAGRVTLTLSASANNAACPVVTDDMVLTIQGSKTVPVVQASGPVAFCASDSVTLTAPDGVSGYLWNTRATTKSIVVKTSGDYTVQVFDASGCSSPVSAPVTVRVSDPVATPVVSNLRNTCPSIVVSLSAATAGTANPAGSSYEYRTGPTVASALVLRPDSVGAGTYYVFRRNGTGCVSNSAPVVVSIVRCQGDTLPVDLAIVKTANKTVAKVGDAITYTLRVTNTSQRTAHRIDIRDVLPTTVQAQSTTATSYSLSNGVVTARIDSLSGGAFRDIVIPVSVIAKGAIVNRADITYLDERDNNLSNNSSSITVRDSVVSTPASGTSVLGLAKAVVGTPTLTNGNTLRVRYRFVATNYGGDTLRNVQITDDLAYAFASAQVQQVKFETVDPNFTLVYKPSYTGGGNTSAIFDSTSYIAPGRSQTFILDVTVLRRAGDTTMTYRNIASGRASGMNATELSTDGSNPDPDSDRNPLNNTSFTVFRIDTTRQQQPALGVALAVVSVVDKGDGSYEVKYRATLKNFGNQTLYGVSLTDTLAKAFPAPTGASIVGSPTVRTGSNLVPNGVYDGKTNLDLLYNSSTLAAGEQDTVTFVISVRPNGNNGLYYTSITGTGRTADSTTVRDVSNNGFDPNPLGTTPTPVRFDQTGGLLGVAKAVGTPVEVQPGIYDVPYTIRLVNRGGVDLKRVQVVDDLSQTFGSGVLIVSNQLSLTAESGLTASTTYTGRGRTTSLLVDSLSNLAAGTTRSVSFTVRVDVRNTDSTRFYNRAFGAALTPANVAVTDTSASGTSDDPNNDLDPRNDSRPTQVVLGPYVGAPHIGLALSIADTVRQADGSYNVTYKLVVRNFGNEVLRRVAITDTLSNVFNTQTGAVYRMVQGPVAISTGSALKLNTAYDGSASPYLVLGDSTSTLAVGKVDTIRFVINVASTSSTTATFRTTAYGTATALSGTVSDVSTDGLLADLNNNNNPGDGNESQPTPLTLPPTNGSFFIPEGFSPNGDGVNDLFVIRGTTGLTISLEVYNRWGHMVYKNDDYKNDWDGTANTGVILDGDKGLPDGTYYYIVRTSDGRKFVRYMTIYR